MTDKFTKFLAYEGKVLIICGSTKLFIEEVKKIHNLTNLTTSIMGKFLGLTAMMAHLEVKEKLDKLTIQLNGKGDVGTLLSIVNIEDKKAKIKGYIQNPSVENGLENVIVGNDGYLDVIKRNNLTNQEYNGFIKLVSGNIIDNFKRYYIDSLQKPTFLDFDVLYNQKNIIASGGYILNIMPDATDEIINKLNATINKAPTIKELLEQDKSLEDIAKIITGDEKLEIIQDDLEVLYNCDCSKIKFRKGISSLGKEEVENIIKEDGKANIVCYFCNKSYDFSKKELQEILEELI